MMSVFSRFHWVLAALAAGCALAMIPAGEANAQTPDRADFCARVAQPISDAKLDAMEREVTRLLPVRHFEKSRNIDIVNVPLTYEAIAPQARVGPDGRYRVEIPEMFQELACDLMIIQTMILTGRMTEPEQLSERFADCTSTNEPTICMFALPKSVSMQIQGRSEPTGELAELLLNWTDQALLYLVVHEYAHILMGHLERPNDGMETQADTFAMTYSTLAGKFSYAPFSVFAVLSMVDNSSQRSTLHRSFLCRAKVMNDVMTAIDNKSGLLMEWPSMQPAAFLADERRVKPVGTLLPPAADRLATEMRCSVGGARDLRALNDDLDRLLKAADDISRAQVPTAADEYAFYDRLMAVRLSTSEGRYMRGTMISVRLRRLNMSKPGDVAWEREYLRMLTRATTNEDRPYLASNDYGRMLSVMVSARWGLLEEGSPLSAVWGLERQLKESMAYNDVFILSYPMAARFALLRGNCEEAKRLLEKTIELSATPEQTRVDIGPYMDMISTRTCAAISAEYRSQFRE